MTLKKYRSFSTVTKTHFQHCHTNTYKIFVSIKKSLITLPLNKTPLHTILIKPRKL